VVNITPEHIGPPPHWHSRGEQGVILGMGRMDNQVSILLDVNRLVIDEEIHLDLQETRSEAVQ